MSNKNLIIFPTNFQNDLELIIICAKVMKDKTVKIDKVIPFN